MAGQLSVLIVGGHPKDAIFYAGGTAAMHVERGDRVCILSPTHGLSHHHRAVNEYIKTGKMPDVESLIEERKSEFVAACGELGVTDARFLGYDDDIPLLKEEIVNDIADVIDDVRPHIIVTHNPYDEVPAHSNASRMTVLAMGAAAGFRPKRPAKPHAAQQLFYYTQQGRSVDETILARVPTTLIDFTEVVHKKAAAMNKFRSQWYGEEFPTQRKLGETLDGNMYAIIARVPYAEHFIAHHPQVHRHLPISEYAMELDEQLEPVRYEYMTQMLLGDEA